MRAKYLYEWFPPILEEDLDSVTIKEVMDEFESELLKNEIGTMLFGDVFNTNGIGNPELPSRMAGELGGEFKRWRDMLTEKTLTIDDLN